MRANNLIALVFFLLMCGSVNGQQDTNTNVLDTNVLQTNAGAAILDGARNAPLGYHFSVQYSRKLWNKFSIGARVGISYAAEKPGTGFQAIDSSNSNIITNNKKTPNRPNYNTNFYNQGWHNLDIETTNKMYSTASVLLGYSVLDGVKHGLKVRAGASISKQNISYLVSAPKEAYDPDGKKVGEYVDIVYMNYIDLGYVLDLQYEYRVNEYFSIGSQFTYNRFQYSPSQSFKLSLTNSISF